MLTRTSVPCGQGGGTWLWEHEPDQSKPERIKRYLCVQVTHAYEHRTPFDNVELTFEGRNLVEAKVLK